MNEEPATSYDRTTAEAQEQSERQLASASIAVVNGVSPLTGATVCSTQANSVLELKASIEEKPGILPVEQLLTDVSEALDEGRLIPQAAEHVPIMIGLFRNAPILGSVTRAIDLLDSDDLSDNSELVQMLDEELVGLRVHEGGGMDQVSSLLLERALSDPSQAHGCAVIAGTLHNHHADMFSREFLNTCRAKFGDFPPSLAGTGALAGVDAAEHEQAKESMLAIVMFVGHLFEWQLLPIRVVAKVFRDCIGSADEGDHVPEEHLVECACELLHIAGGDLDHTVLGKALVTRVLNRLSDLAVKRDMASGASMHRETLKEQFHKIAERRSNDWWFHA